MAPSTKVPSLESTYFTGASLQLYLHPPPSHPEQKRCAYAKGAARMTRIADRLNASIAGRVPIPSSSPSASIILDKRLVSSIRRIPHVWTAQVKNSSPDIRYPRIIVAKIFDPVYFDSEEAEYYDPFALLAKSVSLETEAYRRLESLHGTKVPRFYGHFVTPLRTQGNRTVNVVLLEYIRGRDIRDLIPTEIAGTLCSTHKIALIVAALRLFFDIYALGVVQTDMKPRNVILRQLRHQDQQLEIRSTEGSLLSEVDRPMLQGPPFCLTDGCPLRLEMDCEDIKLVMVDFEMVEFLEPDSDLSHSSTQDIHIKKLLPEYLEDWLMNRIV